MIVRILSNGKSFAGASNYLTHDPDAQTNERVAWTHTLNLANDHVPSAVDEMLWTARNAELLKQEAGIRAGGRATETPVKNLSLNRAREDKPTREHMIETTQEFLRHMNWQEHQAIVVAHNDKPYAHAHVLVNCVHPETGLKLNDGIEQRRAQAWALQYERENNRIYCEQRPLAPEQREATMPHNMWVAFRSAEQEFAQAVREFVPGYETADWKGVLVPKNTPPEIIDKLNSELNAALADPDIKMRLADLGFTPIAGKPADFAKMIAAETDKWGKVVKALGIKAD